MRTSLTIMLMASASMVYGQDRIESPDGKVVMTFQVRAGGIPVYRIDYQGKPLVLESRLGFEPDFTDRFEVTATSVGAHEGQWTNPFGERRTIPDAYREMSVDLRQASGRRLHLTFRAYNEGAALRYTFPAQDTRQFRFAGERTEFRLPPDTYCYEAHGTEDEYKRVKTGEIQPYCERPLTLEYASGLYASLAEADNTAYPRMLLSALSEVPGALVSALGGDTSNTPKPNQRHDPSITLAAGDSTPWRMLVVGEKPGDLLERNYLMLNLNPPCALADTSWINPGKVIRDTTLTTANSKAIIDFAATAGLQYTHLDWKWYGPEDAATGDATTVRAPNLDIPEIIRYGQEKGVGLILYVDRRQIKKQRDMLFPLYEKWGVKGVKIGFIDVGPQAETAWVTQTIQKAAEHHLMLNIHDGYRATGNNRTYPNLLTVEGIRGNEHFPTPEHNCTLPFTRYVAGIGDYTVCYYDGRLKTTHAHQLAMAVVSFSPLQWIFWYDAPNMYNGEPEVEFFRRVPTVWDDTKVVDGKISQYAVLARRSGNNWFVGTINNTQPRILQVPLSFLPPGRSYVAHLYADDPAVQTNTHVAVRTRPVDATTVLEVPLLAGGGLAVWITPSVAPSVPAKNTQNTERRIQKAGSGGQKPGGSAALPFMFLISAWDSANNIKWENGSLTSHVQMVLNKFLAYNNMDQVSFDFAARPKVGFPADAWSDTLLNNEYRSYVWYRNNKQGVSMVALSYTADLIHALYRGCAEVAWNYISQFSCDQKTGALQ